MIAVSSPPQSHCCTMREAILNLEESRIREVANAGIGRNDVLAFWFGESDEVTPELIESLDRRS